jgi:signal transduction histidine kinase
VVTSDEMPTIRASPVLLGQILQNLISNAIKFRADGRPHIHVGAEAEAGGWRFSVRDDGAGIPEDAHTRIFDLFTCLRGDGPGTGVGLALCKRAVEKHGGRIWVESRPREGSTFYFTIPERIS